ncbi:MAG: hypothetical protein B6D64_02110 [Bacteroidetes bacterium 4484_276]|nr:MAG: hypothetical protein B6D64_02110 [Bacteroidetes bacterium 4484_276]
MDNISQPQQLNQIFQSLTPLGLSELDQVMKKLIGLRRQRLSTVLTQTESDLLKKINTSAPAEIQKRFDNLLGKRDNETLSDNEYEELLELTRYTETLNVQRFEYLLELARLRNIPLDELIKQIELKPQLNVA